LENIREKFLRILQKRTLAVDAAIAEVTKLWRASVRSVAAAAADASPAGDIPRNGATRGSPLPG